MRRFTRRGWRAITVGLVIGIVLGASVGTAYAGVAYGDKTYYGPVASRYYWNRSVVQTSPSYGAVGVIQLGKWYGSDIPAGWGGLLARLYNDSGVLVKSSSWWYTDSPIGDGGYFSVPSPHSYVHDSYYARGQTRAWNGSGYNTYNSLMTPYQTY